MADEGGKGLPAVIPARLPARLQRLDDAVGELKAAATAAETARAYSADWRSWSDFAEREGLQVFPARPVDVSRYVAELAKGVHGERRLKARTIERHVISIAAIHRARDVRFERDDPNLERVLAGLRRSLKTRQSGAPALRIEHIREMVRALGVDARGVRNRALFLLAFALGWRRSEIVGINIEDLIFIEERGFVVYLPSSKTDQEGKGRLVAVARGKNPETCPVEAVLAWMRLALFDGEYGPLFVQVNRWGAVQRGVRLRGQALDRLVKEVARQAGVAPDPIEQKLSGKKTFSGHSFRAGHVTQADEGGVVSHWIRRQTGHSSDVMLDRYRRATQIFERSSSNYLGL